MKDKRKKALDLLKTYLMFDDEEMRKTGEYVLRITGKGPIKENKVYLALRAREILLDAVMNNE